MARMFLDLRYSETRLVASIPPFAAPELFAPVSVPDDRPTCCVDALLNWATAHNVPGDLVQLTRPLPALCSDHATPSGE